MISASINVIDQASDAIKAKIAAANPHVLATRLAVPLARKWRDHLKSLPRNKNGYPSTGFWEDAARKVTGIAQADSVLLYSDKLGLRKRYYGGPVTAVNVKNLTIPLCAEAYGTKVADWGYDNLVLIILADGRKFLALWLDNENVSHQFEQTVGKTISKFNKRKAQGKIQRAAHETLSRNVNKLRVNIAGEKHPKVIVLKAKGSGAKTESNIARKLNVKFLFRLIPETKPQTPMPWVIPPDLNVFAYNEVVKAVSPKQ
jgi:hypothetical protein